MRFKNDPTYSVRYRPDNGCHNDGMAIYLEQLLQEGFCDEQTGDVDTWVHVARFGRRLLTTDSQGFVTHTKYVTEAQAMELFAAAEDEYAERCRQWADEYARDALDYPRDCTRTQIED